MCKPCSTAAECQTPEPSEPAGRRREDKSAGSRGLLRVAPAVMTDEEYRRVIADNYELIQWLCNRRVAEYPRTIADDLVQEVVLELLVRPRHRNHEKPFGMLLKDTIWSVASWMRTRSGHTGRLEPASGEVWFDPVSGEVDPAAAAERRLDPSPRLPADVVNAVKSLPPKYRPIARRLMNGTADVCGREAGLAVFRIRERLGLVSFHPADRKPPGGAPVYRVGRAYKRKDGTDYMVAYCHVNRRMIRLGRPHSPQSLARYHQVLTEAGFTPPLPA